MVSGTAELSKRFPPDTTESPAFFAWCTMVMLPVFAGTSKLTVSPVLCVPSERTCAAGSALVTPGRWHAGGVHEPEGRQTFPSFAQQMYCCRHSLSVAQAKAHTDDPLARSVHLPLAHVAAEQSVVQYPDGKPMPSGLQ